MKSSKIVNVQPILPKIDTHNAWTYPMEYVKKLDWSEKRNIRFHGNENSHYKA